MARPFLENHPARARRFCRGAAALTTLVLSSCAGDKPDPGAETPNCPRNDAGAEPPPAAENPPNWLRVSTFDENVAGDGLCSLEEALASVSGTSGGDCPNATGNAVIELAEGSYRVTGPLELGAGVEIRGQGIGRSILSHSGSQPGCAVRLEATNESPSGDFAASSARLTSLTLDGALSASNELTGVCVHAGTLRVRHARVTNFSAGGLLARAASGGSARLEVINSLVDGNRNAGDGGGITYLDPGSTVWVAESALVNNTSEGFGGAIFASGGANADYIVNTTISGNVARNGGGIAGRVTAGLYLGVYWSTITNNRALESGGGIHVLGEDASHTYLVGSIVTDNVAEANAQEANLNAAWGTNFLCTASLLFLGGVERQPDVFPVGTCFFDVADAGLGPLMDVGGKNHLPAHPLLPSSPAINAISEDDSFQPVEQRDTWNEAAGDPPIGTGPADTPRWSLFGRGLDGDVNADMGALEFNPRWEAERLGVAERSSVDHAVDAPNDAFSRGAGAHLSACGPGDYVVYELPVSEGGSYAISTRMKTTPNAGQFTLAWSDAVSGPYLAVGAREDAYSALDDWRTFELGSVSFVDAGRKFFKLTVRGKNEASTGHDLFVDYFEVKKQ